MGELIGTVHIPEVEREMSNITNPQGLGQPGDFLIEVKGDAKKAVLLNEHMPKDCLISGSFQKIKFKKPDDAYYLLPVIFVKCVASSERTPSKQ